MHWKSLLTLLGILPCLAIFGQQAPREVISPAGNTGKTENMSLDWTLGELATATVYSGGLMLTEGFHQPSLIVRQIQNLETRSAEIPEGFNITAFPNPVSSLLHVRLESDGTPEPVSLVLASADGKILNRQEVEAVTSAHEIDMSSFMAGSYLFACLNKDGLPLRTFRILKSK